MKNIRKIPIKEWLAEGYKLFGKDEKKWKFKHSNCGYIQSIADFIKLKEEGWKVLRVKEEEINNLGSLLSSI